MRLQSILFLLLLAIVCEYCYADDDITEVTSTAATTGKPGGWNWDDKDNEVDDKYPDNYYDRSSYKDRDNKNRPSYEDDSDDGKSSYKDDDESYDSLPSYKDDDDEGYDGKPSYKGDDDYDKDYKPSKSRSSKRSIKPNDMGHMNIYVREPSRDGRKKKPKRFRLPTARYERRRFPSFGPLISFLPWLPIFTDRLTKQTFIYSPTGGVYILPPLINFYGRLISVAELIASGYASLVSTGVPPPPAVDIAPLVQPGPVVGPGVPAINPATGGFKGGVRTEYRAFARPKYPKFVEDDEVQRDQERSPTNNYYRSQSRPGYGDVIGSDDQ